MSDSQPTGMNRSPAQPVSNKHDRRNDEALSGRLRRCLDASLEVFNAAEGISVDAYNSEPCYHPMADAKYLSTLGALRDCGLLSQGMAVKGARPALTRLERANLADGDDEACWGLGFEFGGMGAREPYVITTALAVHGMLDLGIDESRELCRRAVTWLRRINDRHGIDLPQSIRVPPFSPGTQITVVNVIASWAAALHRVGSGALDAGTCACLKDWIRSGFIPPIGWPYGPSSPRIDLLHQQYILSALLHLDTDRSFVDNAQRQILGTFSTPDGLVDKIEIVSRDQGLQLQRASGACHLRPYPDHWLVVYHEPARAWSIGETLVTVARLACEDEGREFWRVAGRRLASRVATQWFPNDQPSVESRNNFRWLLHMIHGFACLLASLRQPSLTHQDAAR